MKRFWFSPLRQVFDCSVLAGNNNLIIYHQKAPLLYGYYPMGLNLNFVGMFSAQIG
jgi:hypothetical protein